VGGILKFKKYFFSISSCCGAGLESDIHTVMERSSCSNSLLPVTLMLRPEALLAGLHKQQRSKICERSASRQRNHATGAVWEGEAGQLKGLEDMN